MKKNEVKLSYAAAFEELQRILEGLEQGDIDVDELSNKVKRAAELIDFCQKRLRDTELEVKRVVDSFEKSAKAAVTQGEETEEEPSLF